jgi:hypothetical protein
VAVLVDVGHSADQLNVGGLEIPSSMSPSTPTGVDGEFTPMPAGGNAGMSVNPTERFITMAPLANASAKSVFDGPVRSALLSVCNPNAGFCLTIAGDATLTFAHQNPRISWSGCFLDSEYLDQLGELGQILRDGGADEFALLRFPKRFAWGDQVEALAFWQPLLPVNVTRILFTPLDMNYIYVQMESGHIMYLDLQHDGEDVYDDELIEELFIQIFEANEVAR